MFLHHFTLLFHLLVVGRGCELRGEQVGGYTTHACKDNLPKNILCTPLGRKKRGKFAQALAFYPNGPTTKLNPAACGGHKWGDTLALLGLIIQKSRKGQICRGVA